MPQTLTEPQLGAPAGADRPPRANRLHTTTGRWKLGFLLAVLTMLVWATLPIALRSVLERMDPLTVAWYRFLVAALLVSLYLTFNRGIPRAASFSKSIVILVLAGGAGMAGNYICFLLGLKYTSPAAAQVVIQLAPLFLLAGAVLFFREPFHPVQWLGTAILFGGLLLFFHHRLPDLVAWGDGYGFGVMCIVGASVLWAAYAMAQKQLLRTHTSMSVMWLMYLMGVLSLAPLSDPSQLGLLSWTQILLLAYCSINTVIGYGCFAEALAHWEATKVSAVIAITPLATLSFQRLAAAWRPDLFPAEPLGWLSVLGAGLVVTGSILAALRRPAAR